MNKWYTHVLIKFYSINNDEKNNLHTIGTQNIGSTYECTECDQLFSTIIMLKIIFKLLK